MKMIILIYFIILSIETNPETCLNAELMNAVAEKKTEYIDGEWETATSCKTSNSLPFAYFRLSNICIDMYIKTCNSKNPNKVKTKIELVENCRTNNCLEVKETECVDNISIQQKYEND